MTRPVQHTAAAVAGWLRDGRRVAAGLLVQVDGSSPLDVGASMYIDDQGGIEGSITGGCVEGAVAAAAVCCTGRVIREPPRRACKRDARSGRARPGALRPDTRQGRRATLL